MKNLKEYSPDYQAGFLAGLDHCIDLCDKLAKMPDENNHDPTTIAILAYKRLHKGLVNHKETAIRRLRQN